MEFTKHPAFVKTRFLILSDTHGMEFRSEDKPFQHADVAIHCGDLTEESKLEEYRISVRLLKDICVTLKLVIAGNHDFTMDVPAFRKKVAHAKPSLDPDLVREVYDNDKGARQIFADARAAGVIFLDEGSHQLILENRAILNVYASPWTPSLGDWGFQYPPEQGHNFEIRKGVDLVITHGCTALDIFTRAGERKWSLGAIGPLRHHHTLLILITRDLS